MHPVSLVGGGWGWQVVARLRAQVGAGEAWTSKLGKTGRRGHNFASVFTWRMALHPPLLLAAPPPPPSRRLADDPDAFLALLQDMARAVRSPSLQQRQRQVRATHCTRLWRLATWALTAREQVMAVQCMHLVEIAQAVAVTGGNRNPCMEHGLACSSPVPPI